MVSNQFLACHMYKIQRIMEYDPAQKPRTEFSEMATVPGAIGNIQIRLNTS